jgi:hypothetical protein
VRRRLGGTLVLFALVLVASVVAIAILGAQAARGTSFEPYSTFRAEPDGAGALYDCLVDQHYDCRQETEPLLLLPDDGSLLVLLHPYREPETPPVPGAPPRAFTAPPAIPPNEVDAILGWVKRGGRLLVLECFDNPVYKDLGVTSQGVATIQEAPVGRARVAAYSPVTAAGGTLALACRATLWSDVASFTPLFVDEERRPVVLASDWGKGRVTLVSDPTIATNEGIGRASHVEVLEAIVRDSGSRVVRFDEYRHGFRAERNVMGFARRHGLHVALVQAGLAFVLACWAAARPRRRVRGAGLEKGIESREFVSAMANIYARTKLDRHAVASYERRCERAIALALGAAPGSLKPEELAHRLQVMGVRNYHGWEAVREEADALRAVKGRIGERRLVSFARLATQLEREVREAARLSVDQVIA